MTVNTTNITSGPYSGNDVTTQFSYTFRIENKNQIAIYETDSLGVVSLLTVDSDYSLSGIGDDAGGIATRTAGALPTGSTWFIKSDYKYTQLTDFDSQGGFFPDVHEAAFDKNAILVQQIKDILDRRALLFNDSVDRTTTQNALPAPVTNNVLKWDVDGSLVNDLLTNLVTDITISDTIDRYDSMADLIIASPDSESVYVTSYYDGWGDTVAGPKQGRFLHKTGATNAAPTVGSPASVSTIGTGVQAGYCWDAAGEEWRVSVNQIVNVDNIATLLASSPDSESAYIISYFAGWAATAAGPRGGHFIHRTGSTNAAPSRGTATTVSTIGSGDQAGLYYDLNGNEWEISEFNQILTVEMFGCVGDADGFGASGGRTPTDNALPLQRAFDYLQRGSRSALWFSGGYYYTSASHNLRLPSSGQPDDFSPVIYGNNSVITQRANGLTTGSAFSIGTDTLNPSDPTQPLIPGGNSVVINDLTIMGPLLNETGWDAMSKSGTPAATLTGFELEDFINVRMNNCYAVGYWIGFKTNWCFTIVLESCEAENCYAGFYIEKDSTSTTTTRCRVKSSRYSICFVPTNTTALYGQVWNDFHYENCVVGPYFDPGDGSGFGIADVVFNNFYHEGGGFLEGSALSISSITLANPGVVTTGSAHGFSDNDMIYIAGADASMVELPDGHYQIDNASGNTFEFKALDTTTYTAYTSGGTVQRLREDLIVIGKSLDLTDVEATQTNRTRDVNNVQINFGVESIPASPPSPNNTRIILNDNGKAHNVQIRNSSLRIDNILGYEDVDGFSYSPARIFGGAGFNAREIKANTCQFNFVSNNATAVSTTITTANDLLWQSGALSSTGIVKQANGHYRVNYKHALQDNQDAKIFASMSGVGFIEIDWATTTYFDIKLYDSAAALGGLSSPTVCVEVEIPRQ